MFLCYRSGASLVCTLHYYLHFEQILQDFKSLDEERHIYSCLANISLEKKNVQSRFMIWFFLVI